MLFRATHRGTKEADILIGGYVARHLSILTQTEITDLESLLELPDPLLADWLTGRAAIPPEHDHPLLRAMRDTKQ